MALTTLNAIKIQAGISLSDTSRDLQLSSILTGVTAYVKSQCGRNFESATYTEFYSGDGTAKLILRQFPVISITSIHQDDSAYWSSGVTPFAAATLLTAGTDYSLQSESAANGGTSGIVYRIGGTWRRPIQQQPGFVAPQHGNEIGNIKVVYVAGYAAIPSDLKMAVNSLVMRIANAAGTGGAVSQAAYEDASVTYLAPAEAAGLMGSIESILAGYQDVAV